MAFDWSNPVSAGISAAGNLLGGFLSDKATGSMNRENLALGREQMAMQREFAQHGLRWKVEDAKRAGIHPLYAVGAPAQSPSPVSVTQQPKTGVAEGLAAAGQNISRAVQATMSERERLQNDLLKAQIDGQVIDNRAKSSQLGPSIPGVGGPVTFQGGLKPPEWTADGDRLISTSQGPLIYPQEWTVAQNVEDTVGDVMSEVIMAVNMGTLGLEQAQSRIDKLRRSTKLGGKRAPSTRSQYRERSRVFDERR